MGFEIYSLIQNSSGVLKEITDKISEKPWMLSIKRREFIVIFKKYKRSGFEKLKTQFC